MQGAQKNVSSSAELGEQFALLSMTFFDTQGGQIIRLIWRVRMGLGTYCIILLAFLKKSKPKNFSLETVLDFSKGQTSLHSSQFTVHSPKKAALLYPAILL